jgi:hypothetical protein
LPPQDAACEFEERFWVAAGEQDAEPREDREDRQREAEQIDDDEVRDREEDLEEDLDTRQAIRISDVERDRVRRL